MKRCFFLLFFVFWIVLPSSQANACELTMGYKDGAKGNLIGPPGDDTGAYQDLFTEASKRLGCTLRIIRLPKSRLHERLKEGSIDFYPGASFSEERASYLYYLENGFETGEVGVSRQQQPIIKSLEDLQGLKLLAEVGTSKAYLADYGVELVQTSTLTFDHVTKMLTRRRADFYVADIEFLNGYLARHEKDQLEKLGLMIHPNCCGGRQPMYAAFSIKSPLFSGAANNAFRKDQPLSPLNQQIIPKRNNLVEKLAKILADMKSEGLSAQIYKGQSGRLVQQTSNQGS